MFRAHTRSEVAKDERGKCQRLRWHLGLVRVLLCITEYLFPDVVAAPPGKPRLRGGSWTHSCPAPKNPRESKTVQDCPRLSERIHSSPCYLGTKAIIVQQPPSVLSCNTNVVISDPFSLVTLCETSDSEEKGDAEDTSTCLREIRRASGVHAFPLTSSALAERISIQCQGR